MSTGSYKNFVKVLEKWPLDKAKKGKDVGEALRVMFGQTFPQGSSTIVKDEKTVNRQILALQRLVDSSSKTKYPCDEVTTFTGLEIDQLKQITSTEVMSQMSEDSSEKENQGMLERLKNIRIIK